MAAEAKKLSYRQQRVVDEIATGGHPSIAAAAKKLGLSRQAAYETLARPTVVKNLELHRKQRLDKARGEVAASQRIRRQVERSLDSLDLGDLDPIQTIAVAHKYLQMKELELAIRASYPELEDLAKAAGVVAVHNSRVLSIGRYLQRRLDRIPLEQPVT